MYLLILLSLFYLNPVAGDADRSRSRDQFQDFFPVASSFIPNILQTTCSAEFAIYTDPNILDPPGGDHRISRDLTNCILMAASEFNKFEFAVTGILLAILPAALSALGPSLAEISLLCFRRPVLGFLLACGSPWPNPFQKSESYEVLLVSNTPTREKLYALPFLNGTSRLEKIIISLFEYGIAVAAAANTVYLTYQLTYKAVSLAAITIPILPESTIIFLWAFSAPTVILLLAVTEMRLSCRVSSNYSPGHGQPGVTHWLLHRIKSEITPSLYGLRLPLEERNRHGWSWVYRSIVVGVVRMLSVFHIWIGTLLLGSIMFVTVFDIWLVVWLFFVSTVCGRLVMKFEMYGLTVATLTERDGWLELQSSTI